ncbi:MAG: hypothetical protein CME59_11770 [Halioglobus sp.]|nr:hypothetical protein [Halioglobus sp.]
MNEVLKQRLVGALILVALGVIFWPIIFVDPAARDVSPERAIPPQPEVSAAAVEAPDSAGLRASRPVVAQRQVEDVAEPAAYDPPPPEPAVEAPAAEPAAQQALLREQAPAPLQMDEDGLPVAYILQVVSVSNRDKAAGLRAQLTDMGHKAYVSDVSSNGRTLYRVYIGPKFERAKLESLQAGIDARFGVQSMIRRYVP